MQAASDKLGRLLFEATLRVSVSIPTPRKEEARRQLQELAGSLGHFNSPRTAAFHIYRRTHRRTSTKFLLSTEEVASLFHAPNQTVKAPTLARVESREFPPPTELAAHCGSARRGADRPHAIPLAAG